MGFFNKNKVKEGEKSIKNESNEEKKVVNKIEKAFSSGDKVTRQEIIDINEKLDIVNTNCQYACDEIEDMKPKLLKALDRLGL